MTRILLEVCVDDAAGIAAAAEGGGDRIELCAALALGGLTPSAGLMALAAEAPLPAMAMIRPRAGDFVWSGAEVRAMKAEIEAARSFGLAGIVIGASCPDGRLDRDTLAAFVETAQGLDITLHRAIDLTPDPVGAIAICEALGIRRVLTSGGEKTALQGLDRLAAMTAAAPGVTVMPGGGVNADNVSQFAERLPLREVHASCAAPSPAPSDPRVEAFHFQPPDARRTDPDKVRALRAALDQISASRPPG